MDDQPIQYAPPAQLPSYYPAGLPEDGTSGWGEAMSKEGLQAGGEQRFEDMSNRASHVQLFWIFILFQAVITVKLNFKAGLFSSTFPFEHSFLAKSQC